MSKEAIQMALKSLDIIRASCSAGRMVHADNEAKIAEHILRQALETEQEPVYAFRRKGLDDFCTCDKRRYDELSGKPNLFEVTVFYTAPPKREWVGLTDDDVIYFRSQATFCDEFDAAFMAELIEKDLKEKNHG